MVRCIRPITALLKKGARFDFTTAMEEVVSALPVERLVPLILVLPDWDAVIDKSRPFHLHCDASTDGLRTNLEQEQPDGFVCPNVCVS